MEIFVADARQSAAWRRATERCGPEGNMMMMNVHWQALCTMYQTTDLVRCTDDQETARCVFKEVSMNQKIT